MVIETTDLKEILFAIDEIFSKDKSEYKEKCLEHAHNNFDKEKNIQKYLDIYKKILEKKR